MTRNLMIALLLITSTNYIIGASPEARKLLTDALCNMRDRIILEAKNRTWQKLSSEIQQQEIQLATAALNHQNTQQLPQFQAFQAQIKQKAQSHYWTNLPQDMQAQEIQIAIVALDQNTSTRLWHPEISDSWLRLQNAKHLLQEVQKSDRRNNVQDLQKIESYVDQATKAYAQAWDIWSKS